MEFKQSPKKIEENLNAATQRLLPAVFKETHLGVVGDLAGRWLKLNRAEAEGEIVDASTTNILEAINALNDADLLKDCWERPPVRKPQKKRPDFLQSHDGDRTNHAREAQVSELDVQMAQEKQRRQALADRANAELVNEAIALIQRHSASSHGRTARERDALKQEFDRLTAAKTHPRDLLAAIKEKQNSFYNSSVR
jgi:hypothetical protein